METRRLNRLVWVFALAMGLPAALQAGTGGVSVTCARQEVFHAARTPMYTAHLAERLIVAASDTIYIGGELAERGERYWVDYSQGIVYVRGGMSPGDSIKKVTRTAFIDRMGANTVRSAMLFWDDVVDSSGNIKVQHCVYFPKVRNFAGGDFDFKTETEEYETAITLAAQAVSMTFDDGTTGFDFYKKWMLSY